MKTSRAKVFKLALSMIVFAAVGLLIIAAQKPDEPSYQGKPLRFWLAQLDARSAWDGTNEAAVALRSMGTNALPILAEMLRVREPDWRWWLRQQRWVPFRLRGKEQVPLHAGFGFACLREQAVPALEQLLTDSQTTMNGAIALGRMAPAGASALVRGLTNDDWYVRYSCAAVFSGVGAVDKDRNDYEARVGETARLAIPALIVRLSDTNAEVARTAARALANLGRMPETVLPALAAAITNSALDASVRASASNAFAKLKQGDSR